MEFKESRWEGLFLDKDSGRQIATKNLVKGEAPFREKLVGDYRIWDPYRSKWAAALMKGLEHFPVKKGSRVLYLGSASGQSASYISDIVGESGKVFCIEISGRVMRDLIFLCEKRKNMMPVLADASLPESYSFIGNVDVILQDVAMPNQAEILKRNADVFLEKGSYALISVKSRSIDVSAKPSQIFEKTEKEISKSFNVLEKKRLEPFEKDHIVFLLTKK